MVQFSDYLLEKHIGPGASKLTEVDIPDMSMWTPESSHWIANFFLNSAFGSRFSEPMQAYAYNFLRRAVYAYNAHNQARAMTLKFLAADRQSPNHYAMALFHWETFLGQSWHAYGQLVKAWKAQAFKPKDGSVEERLNTLYNEMKHVESRIENGQMIPGATIPVWLENAGLRSIDSHLSFTETAEVLKDLAKYANALMNPATARAQLALIQST